MFGILESDRIANIYVHNMIVRREKPSIHLLMHMQTAVPFPVRMLPMYRAKNHGEKGTCPGIPSLQSLQIEENKATRHPASCRTCPFLHIPPPFLLVILKGYPKAQAVGLSWRLGHSRQGTRQKKSRPVSKSTSSFAELPTLIPTETHSHLALGCSVGRLTA